MRRSRLLPLLALVPIGWIAALGGGADPAPPRRTTAETLDRRRFAYLEDEPGGRALAAIDAVLVRRGARAALELSISATGAEVQPPRGYQHRQGTNAITARELGALLEGDRVELAVRDAAGAERTGGRLDVGRVGTLPQRRLLPGGHFAFAADSGEPVPLELAVEAPPTIDGSHRFELRLDGVTRLWIEYEFEGSEGRITAFDTPGPATPEGDLE